MTISDGLTFDDVLLKPTHSVVIPAEIDVSTFATGTIQLNIPFISAAMDTVTESALAIALARQGGLGIIHRNMSIERQAEEVNKVKRSESGMIADPITIGPTSKICNALDMMKQHRISGIPVTDNSGKLLGILTNRDLRFETRIDLPVSSVMTKDNLITAPVGTTLAQAQEILHKHRIEKLLIVDNEGILQGLITVKDIQKRISHPNSTKDGRGRLLVGAAVGPANNFLERAQELAIKGADLIAVDSAHGHSQRVLEVVQELRKRLPERVSVIAGNVATEVGALALMLHGANAIKVGVGPGSICTTRIVSGVGVPQLTAIMDCYKATKGRVPLIADGGIKFSGDVTKALAAGADCVMLGGLLAGTDESPGETILYQGRTFKSYRGMGSLAAMNAGSSDRYSQESNGKLVPEGIEGRVPSKGPLSELIFQLVGGLRSGMGYCGSKDIAMLHDRAEFIKISSAGLRESHVHDVAITQEAPNYRIE